MKKLSLLIGGVALISLASCKKDYNCSCTEDGFTFNYPINNAKKKDAEKVCDTWNTLYLMDGGSCTLK